jgi:hypothetical protein
VLHGEHTCTRRLCPCLGSPFWLVPTLNNHTSTTRNTHSLRVDHHTYLTRPVLVLSECLVDLIT